MEKFKLKALQILTPPSSLPFLASPSYISLPLPYQRISRYAVHLSLAASLAGLPTSIMAAAGSDDPDLTLLEPLQKWTKPASLPAAATLFCLKFKCLLARTADKWSALHRPAYQLSCPRESWPAHSVSSLPTAGHPTGGEGELAQGSQNTAPGL